MISKNNVPYYIAGTLATLTLLASGVFAAAPYIGFLAPVAALSIGLPFIIGYAVFSVVTIALSAVAISKNNTISEKEAQLTGEKSKVEAKDTIISEKEAQLSEKEAEVKAKEKDITVKDDKLAKQVEEIEAQLAEKEAEVKAKEKDITVKDDKLAKQVEEIEGKGKTIVEQKKLITEKDKKIEEDALKVEIVDNAAYVLNTAWDTSCLLAKEAAKGTLYAYNNYIPSTESAKGALGSGVKNICDASITFVRGALNSVGSSLYSRLYGTKVSGPEEQFKREDGSKPSMQELTRLDYLDLAVPSSEQKQRANSLDYLNIDNVPKQLDHLNVDAAKSDLMSLSEDQDVFYDAESGDEKDTEVSSLKEQLDENNKTKIQSRISVVYELVKGKFTSFWSGVQNSYVLGTNLLHAQHKNTLANVPQEEVINKEAQKPEEQAEQKPNLQRDNSINNTKEDGKNKRSGATRRKRKQARVEQPIVYAVKISNKYDVLLPECFLG